MNVVVVVPSRGRPDAARLTLEAILDTVVRVSTKVVLAVDADDPEINGYVELVRRPIHFQYREAPRLVVLLPEETGDLVRATNTVSMRIAREDPRCVIGNLGDDHRPRTAGWDRAVLEALATPGIAYGNDLLQGDRLPTAPFISAELVLALGWYALPTCRHMYIDDVWRSLGEGLGVLRYLPDVVIEHMHPGAAKGELDEGYRRADASTEDDRRAFEVWRQRFRDADLEAVRDALAVPA